MMSIFSTISTILVYLQLAWDIAVTCLSILFGRLYPRIEVPFVDLHGKTAIVTGANSGIGLSIAESLAKRNATVYLACRNVEKGRHAASQIIDACGGDSSKRVHVWELDTSSMASVRVFAEAWSSRAGDVKVSVTPKDLLYAFGDMLISSYRRSTSSITTQASHPLPLAKTSPPKAWA